MTANQISVVQRERPQGELQIKVLGALQIVLFGRSISVIPPQARPVLALLAMRVGQHVAVDTFIEELWGDRPLPRNPRGVIRTHASKLRQICGPGRIPRLLPGHETYLLELESRFVDAHEFKNGVAEAQRLYGAARIEEAERILDLALALHGGGEPLIDVHCGPRLNNWRRDILDVMEVAADLWATIRLGTDRHGDALLPLRSRMRDQPNRELTAHLLILAEYRSGHQVEALRVYRDLKERLRTELGVDPSPQLQALEHEILTQDPRLMTRQPMTLQAAVSQVSRPRRLQA